MRKVLLVPFLFIFLSFNNLYAQGRVKVIQKVLLGRGAVQLERFAIRSSKALSHLSASRSLALKGAGVAFIGMEDDVLKYSAKTVDNVSGEIRNFGYKEFESIRERELFIEPDVYTSVEFQKIRKEIKSVNIYDDGSIYHVKTQDDLIELSPHLYYKIEKGRELRNLLAVKTWLINKKEFGIAGIFSPIYDIDTYNALKVIAEKNGISFDIIYKNNLEEIFKKNRGKSLFLTGHFEGAEFYARNIQSERIAEQAFSVSEIERLAAENEVYTIYMGCKTASGTKTSGLLSYVYDDEVISRLRQAFNQESFIDFFSALGSENSPLIVKKMVFEEKRIVIEFEYAPSSLKPVPRSFMRMSSGYIAPSDLPRGFQLFLLNTVNFWYSLAIAVLAIIGMAVAGGKNEEELNTPDKIFCSIILAVSAYWILGKIILAFFY